MQDQDDKRGGLGVCRGVLLGAALWGIIGIVALVINSTGDARNNQRSHGTIIVDRGQHGQ